jgi:LAO/AO transport system kinase
LGGNRAILARAITLVESNSPKHADLAAEVTHELLPHSGRSIRVGITGVPGVGKSTFIESLGCALCAGGAKLAVLAVDPSSTLTGGSILGDKTRMEELSRHPDCFIRPSPSGGALGGVARKTRESIVVCEAGGFDTIFVETVGVGQSETAVRSMVDFFLVLLLAGAGDELQGIKKGIIELADGLAITKADGDNKARAEAARMEIDRVLHYLSPPRRNWRPEVLACSSLTGDGVRGVWEMIRRFQTRSEASGLIEERRQRQSVEWIHSLIEQELWSAFASDPAIAREFPAVERQVREGSLSPTAAAKRLLASRTTNHATS